MDQSNEVVKLLESIVEWIKSQQVQNTTINWTSIIVSLIALGGVCYSVRNAKTNIKMNARIKWIQEVRNEASSIIAKSFTLINEHDEAKSQSILLQVQEKINLLMLYFGPDEVKEKKVILQKIKIIHEKVSSNEGENEKIIKHLEQMLKDNTDYYGKKFSPYTKSLRVGIRGLYENEELTKTDELVEYEDGSKEYVKKRPEYEKKGQELEALQDSSRVVKDNEMLRELLREYLKKEWNVAKKGK